MGERTNESVEMLSPGDRFGDYTVVRLLGKGGMGAVYLLENAEVAQVAAKILDPATAGDHESRKRFLREAELALGVKHPNLVETYDVGEDPDTGLCYILMEYVSGGSLADYLKEHGALPIEDAVAVVQAMASVLELARQKGIVHRDIKPANIMFDAEGTPKLADLGIARGGIAGTETTTVTQTGMMIGTPAYMAPEQMLDAHNVDCRADIYSLGVVFFEMLTGERPNKDDTVVQLMARAVKGEPLPDVRTLRPEVSASLAQLLNMMVAPDKDGRISTPGQITSALDIIARGGTFAAKPMVRTSFLDGRARTPAVPQANRDQKPFPVKVLFPVALLAGIAAAFVVLAPKDASVKQTNHRPAQESMVQTVIRTNVVEKIVEKTRVVTNRVVERRGEDASLSRLKIKKEDFKGESTERSRPESPVDKEAAGVASAVCVKESSGQIDPETLQDPDATRATQKAFDALFPGWKVSAVLQGTANWAFGYQTSWRGRKDVVATHPQSMEEPTIISRNLKVGRGHPVLNLEVASQNVDADFVLSVRVNGETALGPQLICTPEDEPYARIRVPLSAYVGKDARIEIVHVANNWFYEHAFWGKIEIVEGTGKEATGLVGVKRTEVFPAANLNNAKWRRRSPWRYTERNPGVNWKDASFNDARWKRSAKAFGREAGPAMSVAELWQGKRIWLRRTFAWNVSQPVYNAVFDMRFDQDVEMFLNGVLILKRDGWNTNWDLHAADRAAFTKTLRQGENVLAVTLRGDGPSFFDCGLVVETLDCESQDAKGPRQDRESRYTEEGFLEESVFDETKFSDKDSTRRVQKTLDALFPGWKTSKNAANAVHLNEKIGYVAEICGRQDVLATLPPSRQSPVRLTRTMVIPENAKLFFAVRKNPTAGGGLIVQVYANGKRRWKGPVTDGAWFEHSVDLSDLAGRKARLEMRHLIHPDFGNARALWSDISVR